MPRQPRFYSPGVVLHVVQRGNNREACFTKPDDHRFYLQCLRDAAIEHGVDVHAYALITNRVHLLVSPASPESLPRAMQTLGRRYVGRFNFVYRRTGTLWEGRYKAALVDSDEYLLICMRYIELNPVRARMVEHAAQYRWSSFRANALGDHDPLVKPQPFRHSLPQPMRDTLHIAPALRQACPLKRLRQFPTPPSSSGSWVKPPSTRK